MDIIAQKALLEALRYSYLSMRLAAARHVGHESSGLLAPTPSANNGHINEKLPALGAHWIRKCVVRPFEAIRNRTI